MLNQWNTEHIFCSPARGQVKQYCFTLIELLVVISIIAILAAMLFPALGKVKDTGTRAVCINNMKQYFAALNAYSSDHNDLIPPHMIPYQRLESNGTTSTQYLHITRQLVDNYSKFFSDQRRYVANTPKKTRSQQGLVCPWYNEKRFYYNSHNFDSGYTPGTYRRVPKSHSLSDLNFNRVKKPASKAYIMEYIGGYGQFCKSIPGHALTAIDKQKNIAYWVVDNRVKYFDDPFVQSSGFPGELNQRYAPEAQVMRDLMKGRHGGVNNTVWLDGHVSSASGKALQKDWNKEHEPYTTLTPAQQKFGYYTH